MTALPWATVLALAPLAAAAPPPGPATVTLTPVSATSIRIEWSPVAGAVRYVISRNGAEDIALEANAGHLQGNRFVYTDIGRRPATLHTYSVTAHFAPPTTPGRSAAAQLLTPAALAPSSFRATVGGPHRIVLVWNGRPEAARYEIIRNGGNLPATVLRPQGLSYVDDSLPAGDYTYTVYSIVRLASGEELAGEMSNPLTIRSRPFNMLAIGDSVMWGQGLLPSNKFAFKVRDWISSQIGKPVEMRIRAHSGAVTFPPAGGPVHENRSYDGEVPADWPTISHQIALASSPAVADQPPAADIDLVLVNGCANNVGIITVLNPIPLPDQDDASLRNKTQAVCGAGMTNILRELVRRFPNADVIVTGYFPYVSRESDLAKLLPVLALVGAAVPPDPLVGGILTTTAYRERIALRSDIFFEESNRGLQGAVDVVNREGAPGRTRFDQLRFARLNPAPSNAYAGIQSWQFLIPAPPFVQDEVYEARRLQCNKVQSEAQGNPDLMPGTNLLCLQASMGHPNAAGAQAYTDAIRSVATPLVANWRTAHKSAVASDDSFVVRAQQFAMDAGGGTVLMTANDAASGAPLAGQVQFNGVPAGALGARLQYAFQRDNPAGITVSVVVAGRTPRYVSIPARTFSVVVDLRDGGDPRSAVVSAMDSVSGQLLAGTVIMRSPTGSSTTGATGQPITYPSCSTPPPLIFRRLDRREDGTACAGTVRVPFYPDVVFQDTPGARIIR